MLSETIRHRGVSNGEIFLSNKKFADAIIRQSEIHFVTVNKG
jgi:hypothetical protein